MWKHIEGDFLFQVFCLSDLKKWPSNVETSKGVKLK